MLASHRLQTFLIWILTAGVIEAQNGFNPQQPTDIECGQRVTGFIELGETLRFSFTNDQPQDVTFTDCNSDFDPMLKLLDSNENYIHHQSHNGCDGDDCYHHDYNCSEWKETFTMEDLPPGEYTLELTPFPWFYSVSYLSFVLEIICPAAMIFNEIHCGQTSFVGAVDSVANTAYFNFTIFQEFASVVFTDCGTTDVASFYLKDSSWTDIHSQSANNCDGNDDCFDPNFCTDIHHETVVMELLSPGTYYPLIESDFSDSFMLTVICDTEEPYHFIVGSALLSWHEADEWCLSHYGSPLVSIHNEEEHAAATKACSRSGGCWIGDDDTEFSAFGFATTDTWNESDFASTATWNECVYQNEYGVWEETHCNDLHRPLCPATDAQQTVTGCHWRTDSVDTESDELYIGVFVDAMECKDTVQSVCPWANVAAFDRHGACFCSHAEEGSVDDNSHSERFKCFFGDGTIDDTLVCSQHSDCIYDDAFCAHNGFCSLCDGCLECESGVDGTCGRCGYDYPLCSQHSDHDGNTQHSVFVVFLSVGFFLFYN